MSTLRFLPSGRLFSFADLRDWHTSDPAEALSENQRATLEFCRDWLNGVDHFTLHTSGSTGAPKPIQVTRQQMEASAHATAAAIGLQAGMQALVCLPTRYIAGRMMLVRGLVLGMSLIVVEPSSNPLAGLLHDERIDFAAFTPMQMSVILESGGKGERRKEGHENTETQKLGGRGVGEDTPLHPFTPSPLHLFLNSMHAILIGGGPVSAVLEAQIGQLTTPVYHTYAMTETVSHVALRRMNGAERSDRFVPLPGVEMGVDERGCLHIQAEMTGGQVVQTNDLVELHADGSFRWLGRWDNVINSGGVKVQVEQVEAAVEQVLLEMTRPAPRFFVAGVADERLGEQVTLFVEGSAWADEVEAQVLGLLRGRVEKYALPRAVVYVDRFRETPTGKVDRLGTVRE